MSIIASLSQWVVTQTPAAAEPGAAAGPMAQLIQFAPFVLMFVVLYFMWIRPANKQRREHQNLLDALKKDDEVITASGVIGRVVTIDNQIATVEIADKVKVRILRDRIAGRWNPSAPQPQQQK